jgi:hypothetical protein
VPPGTTLGPLSCRQVGIEDTNICRPSSLLNAMVFSLNDGDKREIGQVDTRILDLERQKLTNS